MKDAGKKVMKMLFILAMSVFANIANAAYLENVSVVQLIPENGSIKLRIEPSGSTDHSYFFVQMSNKDPEAFEKLVKAIQKAKRQSQNQLDLDILSFSNSPSGSYYNSESVTFNLKTNREPNSVHHKAKKSASTR